jgi:hypothetical protein
VLPIRRYRSASREFPRRSLEGDEADHGDVPCRHAEIAALRAELNQ